jgi:hypothetical protein
MRIVTLSLSLLLLLLLHSYSLSLPLTATARSSQSLPPHTRVSYVSQHRIQHRMCVIFKST